MQAIMQDKEMIMRKRQLPIIFFAGMVLLFAGCAQNKTANINLAQSHNPSAHHILAPGMGTIGIIQEGRMEVFYQDEEGQWLPDPASGFTLPKNNNGILSMGAGTIAVQEGKTLNFYRMGSDNLWNKETAYSFELPRAFDRLTAMKMPWEMGIVGVETGRVIDFYYFADGKWEVDPTASFVIPEGMQEVHPLGDMTLAVVDGKKAGLYFLSPEAGWTFMDYNPFVLLLPTEQKAVIPYDQHTLAVRTNNDLLFFQLDLDEDRWIVRKDLQFELPF